MDCAKLYNLLFCSKNYSGNVKVTYINYVLPAEAQIGECRIHCGIVWWIYSKWWKKTISEVLFYFLIRDPRGVLLWNINCSTYLALLF